MSPWSWNSPSDIIAAATDSEDDVLKCLIELAENLLKTQMEESELADDDPQVYYMISAWARMCKILGPPSIPLCIHLSLLPVKNKKVNSMIRYMNV
jgi:hypothetical protein